jgi:hypothetical protein
MTEHNEHDERGDRRVFEPAIARLREELADCERQASATRALIEALLVRAGATDPTRARIATAKARTRGRHRSSRATQKRAPAPHRAAVPGESGNGGSAKELAEIVAVVARSQRDIEAAIRSKDASRMKMAITAIARAERRGGEILAELKGQSLPISLADRKRWREAAARSPKAFEVELRRDVAKAQARISGNGASAVAVDKAKPSSRPPAPAQSPAKRFGAGTPRESHTKLSDWHQEADGSLTRTVTSGEDAAAAAPAGA